MARGYHADLPVELKSSSKRQCVYTPGAGSQDVTFELTGLPVKRRKHWVYATNLVVEARTTFDQAASGGSAVKRDKLFKLMRSARISSPLLRDFYPREHTTGALVGNVIAPLCNRFGHPTPLGADIASTDGDTAITVQWQFPIALNTMVDPMDTAHLLGLFEGGTIDLVFEGTGVFDGDSTGAVIKTSVTVRAWFETVSSRQLWLPGAFGFRLYKTPGDSSDYRLQSFGRGADIHGDQHRVGFLGYLTNAAGLGLGGADAADDLQEYTFRDFDLVDVQNPRMAVKSMLAEMGQDHSAVGSPTRWPYAAATANGSVQDNPAGGLLFYPVRMLGLDAQISRMRRFPKPLQVQGYMKFGSQASAEAKFFALHFWKYNEKFESEFRAAFGIPDALVAVPKLASGKPLTPSAIPATDVGVRRKFYPRG